MDRGTDDLPAQVVTVPDSLRPGFTQIPNAVLFDGTLSMGAKLTYGLLLSYAWYNHAVFPRQDTLAEAIGVSDRQIRTYRQELEAHGLLKTSGRGVGKTPLYHLQKPPRRKWASGHRRKWASGEED